MKEIHFNISPTACINLQVDEGGVSFSARFSGVSKEIFFPLGNLISIFVPSTGLTFPMGVSIEPHHVVPYFINLKRNLETPTVAEPVKVSKKPTLTVVK